jgi:hypothetical protein
MLLLSILLITANDAHPESGFLAQFDLGVGYTSIADNSSGDSNSSGPAINGGFHFGYEFNRSFALALHGFASGEFQTGNTPQDRPEPGNVGYILGVGPEVILSASDWRFGFTPSFAFLVWSAFGSDTASSLGGVVSISRDWWISERWTAGVRTEFIYAHASNAFGSDSVNAFSGSIGVSFSYY